MQIWEQQRKETFASFAEVNASVLGGVFFRPRGMGGLGRGFAHLGDDSFDIDVVADDGGVVAAEFKRHSFQGRRRGRHDFLARRDGARESNLVDIRVRREHGTQIFRATERLQYARREEPSGEFREFEIAVRGIGRRFKDQRVGGDERRGDFAHCQQNWIVPGDNASDDP